MATRIHHGPPGSFKSFTLVQRFAIPALQSGRVVVTNIRGFDDIDRVKDAFPDMDFPSSATILWLDTTTADARAMLACFYKWVPFGALVIIDEIQQIYPDRRDFRLESLDKWHPNPDDVFDVGMVAEGRPEDVFTAYDKQRHFNWDILASTTNIAKVKREIREVTDFAYRHRDLSGFLPWWQDTWIEHKHDPENNGKSKAHLAATPERYKADPRIYRCYQSTATGEHVKAGRKSVFADPKVLGFIVLVAVCGLAYALVASVAPAGPPAVGAPGAAGPEADRPRPVPPGSFGPGGPAPVKTAAFYPVPVKRAQLDADTVRTWSYRGVAQEDLPAVPMTCRIYKKHVKCTVKRDTPDDFQAVAVSTSRVCHDHYCTLYFPVNPPKPEKTVSGNILSAAILK